jgi:5-methylcytosine-specific restriction endonuclease McrA
MPTRYYINDKIRWATYNRDNCTCFYCREKCIYHETAINRLTLDHIVPLSQLAKNDPRKKDPKNLITACAKCNVQRGETHIDTWLTTKGRTSQELKARLNTPLCDSLLSKLKKMTIDAVRIHVLSI